MRRIVIGTVVMLVGTMACVGPGPSSSSEPSVLSPQSSGPKRLVAAIMVEPPALYRPLIPGVLVIQSDILADTILNVGLTIVDQEGRRRAVIAEAVPSLENGLWRMLPDGQMELRWRIRTGAEWHDGTSLTADDLVFSARAGQDPSLPELRAAGSGAYELVERVEAVDPQTVAAIFKKPFIWADRLFSTGSEGVAQPIPRHLLERVYADGREVFLQAPYWSREYVGLGPYKLREWVVGSHLLLDANDRYVLGRPKIDEMEVRFILDANTVGASILAGAVQMTLGIALNLEQSLELRDQWQDGKLNVANVSYWLTVFPQFVNPNPPVVADLRFRRALLQAIDRQAMVETIMAGLVPIAHSYIKPDAPEARETDRYVVRYEYDPRRAAQVLEELGYTKGADGRLRDSSAQPLTVEVRATSSPAIHAKSMFPVADYWQRLGLSVDPLVVPVQSIRDREFQATFPAFDVGRRPNGAEYVERFHSSEAGLPQNRFQGRNTPRYMTPEFDGLLEQYLATIPWEPRMQVLGQIMRHFTDQLVTMGLFYDVGPTLVSNRLVNVPVYNPTANVHEWDLKS